MVTQKPLDIHQQELVNIVKATHRNLAIARKVRTNELSRRISAALLGNKQDADDRMAQAKQVFEQSKLFISLSAERAAERLSIQIKEDLDVELVAHEAALDDALVAAYENNVPIRRIAIDGFGNRYDGGVQQLLVKLREDGRIGNRIGYQSRDEDSHGEVEFPKPIDVTSILEDATTVAGPAFTLLENPLELVAPDEKGNDGVSVAAVSLQFDSRDPWFKRIQKNARPGTLHMRATSCTMYLHPATGELVVWESKEAGATLWDHPVARWVKDHPDEAIAGYRAAFSPAE